MGWRFPCGCAGGPYGRGRCFAALHGHRHCQWGNAASGALHRDHRRVRHFGTGGSRFQIGGPAGAFIVLVAGTIDGTALTALLLATLMAGGFLTLIGLLRLGGLIRLIPHAVTVGFTAGIGAIILASQVKDLFGSGLRRASLPPSCPRSRRWSATGGM